jgi:5-methylcytosine-specific restriction endonuclease McrBC regulatory subunit McrC
MGLYLNPIVLINPKPHKERKVEVIHGPAFPIEKVFFSYIYYGFRQTQSD